MAVSGATIVSLAEKELGDPYVFGAEGPNSFDCSGLVQYVFKKVGIRTPRTAAQQQHFGTAVSRANIRPGDMIFFNWSGHGAAEHVGIYAGNNILVEAPHTGDHVKKIKMSSYMWANEVAIRRFPGVTGGPDTSEAAAAIAGAVGAGAGAIKGGGVTGALGGAVAELHDIGTSLGSVGKLAELATKAFLPSNIMRGFAALLGTMFVLIGIFFMSREARHDG
jgi:hypothetical protein